MRTMRNYLEVLTLVATNNDQPNEVELFKSELHAAVLKGFWERRLARGTTIRAQLAEDNPEALTVDDYDAALIGTIERCGSPTLALYDYEALIQVCMNQMSEEFVEEDLYTLAQEYVDFNIVGAFMGEHTPYIFHAPLDDEAEGGMGYGE